MTNNVEIARLPNEVCAVMAPILRSALFTVCLAIAAPAHAQTAATLNVSARVVEQCTISLKARKSLILLALRTGRRELLQKCSGGIVGRVDQRSVASAALQPRIALPARIRKAVIAKRTSSGRSDVVLVTVSY